MEFFMSVYGWLKVNYIDMFMALSMLVAALEMVVRLTPTKADDGFVERLGSWNRKIMDFLKIPNIKKKEEPKQ